MTLSLSLQDWQCTSDNRAVYLDFGQHNQGGTCVRLMQGLLKLEHICLSLTRDIL